jgi:hypothetical protein
MVAVSLVALLGFLGLVVDLGRMFVMKAELQNAADACALAAAQELDGNATALTRATNAGITIGTRNRQNFQSAAVAVTAANASFATALSSASGDDSNYLTQAAGAPANSKYARCALTLAGIPMTFSSVLGIGAQSVTAQAVAMRAPGQSNCAIPLAVCTKGPAPSYGLVPGHWINTTFKSGGGTTGSFSWIDFSPPAGGESELAGSLTGQGTCDTAPVTTLVGQPGNMGTQAIRAWNSRFGLYANGAGNPQPDTAPPDFTGYAYTPTSWPSQQNALANFLNVERVSDAPYQGNAGTGLNIAKTMSSLTSAQLAVSGANRRLGIAPIVDCAGWAGAQTVPLLAYACVLMLHPIANSTDAVYMEYIGPASDPGSPCTSSGLPGAGAGALVPTLVQ